MENYPSSSDIAEVCHQIRQLIDLANIDDIDTQLKILNDIARSIENTRNRKSCKEETTIDK